MKVKICGITNHEDAQKAVYYGAHAVGFIFHKKSPRYVSPSKIRKVIESLPPFIVPVGVFADLNEQAVRDICHFTRIKTVQFHGDEKPVYCKRFSDFKIIKAFRVHDLFDFTTVEKYKVDAYLFDTFEGMPPPSDVARIKKIEMVDQNIFARTFHVHSTIKTDSYT